MKLFTRVREGDSIYGAFISYRFDRFPNYAKKESDLLLWSLGIAINLYWIYITWQMGNIDTRKNTHIVVV